MFNSFIRRIALLALLACTSVASAQPANTPPAPADVEKRIEALVSKMTLEEKIDLIGGVDRFFVRAVPQIGLPRLKMADGPFGVRNPGFQSTAMAAGIALASTWNPALAEKVGVELGRDSRARGVHFLLGPGVNIYRAPMNGRNFEYFGEDPLLAARITVGYIKGVQSQGVSATVKHFFANNSEFDRNNTDSLVDERTLHEIYFPAFEAAVKDAHVGALMTSYNLVNGVHTSQDALYMNGVVKRDWGFPGIVMSDWMSVYDGVAAAKGGLDFEMPSGAFMNRETLIPAIKDGRLAMPAIDDKVRRLLRVAVTFGWLDREQTDLSIPWMNRRGTAVALDAAREGMVLLKNAGGVLPISPKAVKTVAVIGPLAYPGIPVGGGSAGVQPFRTVSTLEGITEALGPSVNVLYHRGLPTFNELADRTTFTTEPGGNTPGVKVEFFRGLTLSGSPEVTRVDAHVNLVGTYLPRTLAAGVDGDSSSARWTGYFTPANAGSHRLFVFDFRGEGGCRAMVDDKTVIDNWDVSKAMLSDTALQLSAAPHKVVLECFRRRVPGSTGVFVRLGIVPDSGVVETEAKAIAAKADVVIAAVGFDNQIESESGDRTFGLPAGQDVLIRELAAANPKTIVVVTSGGGVDMTRWIDNVPAVMMTWLAGEQGGTAVGQLLTGAANFSGRLPITIEKRWEDNPNHDSYYPAPGSRQVQYKNGVFVGYRGFEQNKTAPLFPFGFGLSYTTFSYANLAISPKADSAASTYQVTFDVSNTGTVVGAEVAQVYVAPPASTKVARPPKELKGFAKVLLAPGETKRVSVELDARAFSYWDATAHQWKVDAGDYAVLVGPSSASTPLKATASVK